MVSLLAAGDGRRRPLLSLGRLWRDARVRFPTLWGVQYPDDCRLDDREILRCLEMAHKVQLIRFRIWKARACDAAAVTAVAVTGGAKAPRDSEHYYSPLMEELLSFQEVSP